MRNVIGVICGLTSLTACAAPTVAVFNPTVQYVPTCPVGVAVYVDRSNSPSDAKEIAILTGYGRDQSDLDAMKAAAAKVGATGLALGGTRGTTYRGTSTGEHQDAVVLLAPSDSARVRQACSTVRHAGPFGDSVALSRGQLDTLRSYRLRKVTFVNAPMSFGKDWITDSRLYDVTADSIKFSIGYNYLGLPIEAVVSFRQDPGDRKRVVINLRTPKPPPSH